MTDHIKRLQAMRASTVIIVDTDIQNPFGEHNMPKSDDMVRIEIVLPSALRESFRTALDRAGERQSEVLRRAIEDYCKAHGVDVDTREVKWGGKRE